MERKATHCIKLIELIDQMSTQCVQHWIYTTELHRNAMYSVNLVSIPFASKCELLWPTKVKFLRMGTNYNRLSEVSWVSSASVAKHLNGLTKYKSRNLLPGLIQVSDVQFELFAATIKPCWDATTQLHALDWANFLKECSIENKSVLKTNLCLTRNLLFQSKYFSCNKIDPNDPIGVFCNIGILFEIKLSQSAQYSKL